MKNQKVSTGFQRYTGFTLAEILIILAVIGVVAAITIPALNDKIQDMQFKSAWKKEYSTIEQAVKMILTDNPTLEDLCTTDLNNCFGDILATHLKYSKYCKNNVTAGICFHDYINIKNFNNDFLTTLTADNSPLHGNSHNGFILNDGSLMAFYYRDNTPDSDMDCYKGVKAGGSSVAAITIDVNGWKGPNQLGKDIFSAIVHVDKVTPSGRGCFPCLAGATDEHNGFGCAYKVLQNKDY